MNEQEMADPDSAMNEGDIEQKFKRIFHPFHRTAWSQRTSGFPIYVFRACGEIIPFVRSTKRAEYWEVPADTIYLIWHYQSNSGRKKIYLLKPEDGLPDAGIYGDECDPHNIIGLPPTLRDHIAKWLWG